MKLREVIITYLQDRNLYHETDDLLVDELLFNIKLSKDAKESISSAGLMINVTRNPEREAYYVPNPAVSIYQQCLKNIQALFRQLNLSPNERQKLKMELAGKPDEFDQIF